MKQAIETRFLDLLRGQLSLAADTSIQLDRDLVDLGLDSIGAINLLLDMEQAFSVSFPGAMLTAETFKTSASLISALEEVSNE